MAKENNPPPPLPSYLYISLSPIILSPIFPPNGFVVYAIFS